MIEIPTDTLFKDTLSAEIRSLLAADVSGKHRAFYCTVTHFNEVPLTLGVELRKSIATGKPIWNIVATASNIVARAADLELHSNCKQYPITGSFKLPNDLI